MKALRTKLIYFILPGIIFVVGMILAGSGNQDADRLKHLSEGLTMVSLNPPNDLNFAGEIVPIHDFDVRERFDQELVRNVFYHSATIMNLKRANRWQGEMKRILKSEGIPEDFFYLCIAESHLTNAVSPAGARGFWQFMKATGEMYGLEISKQVDERYDPIKSTYAACKYLRDAYRKFGNWTLVAASYNMGMGGVMNAMQKQQVDNYYDLYLNRETAAYVFRIVAIKSIFQNPEQYGFNVDGLHMYSPLRYKTVKVDTTIKDMVKFAIAHGTSYKMLRVLNPWILDDELVVAVGKSYAIKIPHDANFQASELEVSPIPVDSTSKLVVDSVKADSVKPKEKPKVPADTNSAGENTGGG